MKKNKDQQQNNFTPKHRKTKIEFARNIAEKIIIKYPRLGDRLDIAMLIRDILELDSFATKP
jgi:hypothetical protein